MKTKSKTWRFPEMEAQTSSHPAHPSDQADPMNLGLTGVDRPVDALQRVDRPANPDIE